MLLNNQWIKEEIKKYLETNDNEDTIIPKHMGFSKSSNREVHSNTNLPQETNKKSQTGVPIVAQWLANPTKNHEVSGSIPGLA